MALKRRNRVEATFSMSSMTDLIFLLLLFFVMASTMSSPNDIKINLPQARAKTNTKQVVAKVFIDNLGGYSVALGREKPLSIDAEDLELYLSSVQQQDSTMYIALHADEDISYKEVVRVLDIANEHKMKLVVATKK
ncbi:MAG: biopolymer transporter ExbD [Paludibacteraceae bacterium]|nr:biopolymer transporter ExbD [Paludibacteraceae bacterium]MBR6354886.1 biopolymer transporter ExbD [Paludibacteraceae bacterium]